MKETELLSKIVSIVRGADGLTPALRQIQALIASECGGALLIIRPASSNKAIAASPAVCDFLESCEFPFRGLYTAPLKAGHRDQGTFAACIGTWGVPGDTLRRLATFVGENLADLARRPGIRALNYVEAS